MTFAIGRRAFLAGAPLALTLGAEAQARKPGGVGEPGQLSLLEWKLDSSLDAYGRTVARAMVNGQGPFRFMVDTGSSASVVSMDLAEKLGLTFHGATVIHGTTGQATMPVASAETFEVGAVEKRKHRLVVMTRPFSANADGIIGADIFAGRRLVFDVARRSVKVANPRAAQSVKVDTSFRLRDNRLAELRGWIGKVKAGMIIDSGAVCSIINPALRAELRSLHPGVRTLPEVAVTGLTGQVLVGEGVFLPNLQMKSVKISGAVAVAADAPVFRLWGLHEEPAMIVGADILSRFPRFAIDYGIGAFDIGPQAMAPLGSSMA